MLLAAKLIKIAEFECEIHFSPGYVVNGLQLTGFWKPTFDFIFMGLYSKKDINAIFE